MRAFLHFLLSLVLWGIFFYHWHIVSQRGITSGTALAIKVLSLLMLFGLTVTVFWVAHNLRIGQISRRQQLPTPPPADLTHDSLGRPIHAPDLEILRQAALIDIQVTEAGKEYKPSPGDS